MHHLVCLSLAIALAIPFTAPYAAASPGTGLRILGPAPGNATTPVVNERGRLALRVVDAGGQSVAVSRWTSDSPAVARVTKRGVLKGRLYGFAAVTATTSLGDVRAFVVVARVTRRRGAMAHGDTKADVGGNVYLSSPRQHVIYQSDGFSSGVMAGAAGQSGYADGVGQNARFNAPTGLAVDNRADGGIYVADTMNSCIRKISPSGRVTVALGTPQVEGTMYGDETPTAEAALSGPSGVASVGRNFYFADTGNHAIYYADFQRGEVRLVCGEPGTPGYEDGDGRAARFDRPTGLAISTSGRLLAVADTGNHRVRLVGLAEDGDGRIVGQVSTLGVSSSARGVEISKQRRGDDPGDAIAFAGPTSVSFDATENVYVIDEMGASVVVRPANGLPEKVDLAQPGTLGDPASVTVRGTEAFVLDESASTDAEAIRVAEVGAPVIDLVTPSLGPLAGSEEDVVVDGQNFSKEARVTLGDREITDFVVESARRIRILRTPAQDAPGVRTLTVATRGGVDQERFEVRSKGLDEISAGQITTIAGGIAYIGDGGPAGLATMKDPRGIAVDGAGNVFVADTTNNRIRRIDASSGLITTVVGTGDGGEGGDGGLATAARLNRPYRVVVDSAGNLFVADTGNHRIRRVDAVTGVITTVAAQVDAYDVAVDPAGNLFVADYTNHRVRRVDASSGQVTTVAGTTEQGYDGDDKPATAARLFGPNGVALDAGGNLFIADTLNDRVRRVDASTGLISTVAGTGVDGYDGDDKPAVAAQLNGPSDVEVDPAGDLFIADLANARIRRVDSATGSIETVAGTGVYGFAGDGGTATDARIYYAFGVALDSSGDLFVADTYNHRVRRVDVSSERISTIGGTGDSGYEGDGRPAPGARLNTPVDVAVDADGDVFIADSGLRRVLRVEASTGVMTAVAGTGSALFNGDGGPAISTNLNAPKGLSLDGRGNLFIADAGACVVRRIDASSKTINIVAGALRAGYNGDGISATTAELNGPQGVAVDPAGNVFIADFANHRVRRVDASTGLISTIAGTGVAGFNGDDQPATAAQLYFPTGVAVDAAGNVFIAEDVNNRIRRVDAVTGRITTVGGPVLLGQMFGLALDGSGDLFAPLVFQHQVRRVDASSGAVTIFAGTGQIGFSGESGYDGDGAPAVAARLNRPSGVAFGPTGDLYIADTGNTAIRVVKAQR